MREKELIGKFIEQNRPLIQQVDNIPDTLEVFWNMEEPPPLKTKRFLLERKVVIEQVMEKLIAFEELFEEGVG